jgi:hypothetical protein
LTDESFCQCLAAELPLYVLQISNVSSPPLLPFFFPPSSPSRGGLYSLKHNSI